MFGGVQHLLVGNQEEVPFAFLRVLFSLWQGKSQQKPRFVGVPHYFDNALVFHGVLSPFFWRQISTEGIWQL